MQSADTIEPLLTSAEVAAIFRWSPQTLKLKRRLGLAPASLRIGGRVCFRRADVAAFLASCVPAGVPPPAGPPTRPSQAPQFGEPFEPHTTDLRCRDGQEFVPVHFALGCPLAQAVDALMVEAEADWLRATHQDIFVMLWTWGHSECVGSWPQEPACLAAALETPRGQLAADLRRLGIVAESCDTDRGPGLDLIRVAAPSQRRRYPGQGRSR